MLCRLIAIVAVLGYGRLLMSGPTDAGSSNQHFDVLVLAPETPVVMRIHVEFERGQTLEDNRSQYANEWLGRFDTNSDDQLDDQEAFRIPTFGRFDDLSGELGDEWARLDVAPTDGVISSTEFLMHVNAAMGTGLSISRRQTRASQTVVLYPRLDVDADGQVSTEELTEGLSLLEPFDFDDDESLSAAELQPFPASMQASQAMQMKAEQSPFVVLDRTLNLESVLRRLQSLYGDEVPVDTWRERLTDPHPDVDVTIHFPTRRPKRITVDPVSTSERVTIKGESDRRRLALKLGDLSVDATLRDAQASIEVISSKYLQLQFRYADSNGDKHLNPQEYDKLNVEGAPFSAVDVDQDGQISNEEIASFIEQRALLSRCRLEMTIENDTTSLFETLDQDEDRRLSPREFQRGVDPMLALDRNGNGKLSESELVTKYRLEFAVTRPAEFDDLSGGGAMAAMAAEARLPILRPVTQGPEWFRRMDRNQDGDVTWREFLGPRKAFEQFDSDDNGFIDVAEAETSP